MPPPASDITGLEDLPPSLRRDWHRGDFATRYRIAGHLGSGGMGHVVAAHRIGTDREVAIKFPVLEGDDPKPALKRFFREVQAIARLRSPHVAKLLDYGRLEGGAPYLVMERLHGQTAREVVSERGALPIAEAVDAVLQASHAIAEAHTHGIIHRDLKPANIFFSKGDGGKPLVKVLDFGVAKLSNRSDVQELTETGITVGSPRYMAPEQLTARAVSPQTDIWGLGQVLYELLTGSPAYPAATHGELWEMFFLGVKPVKELREDVPDVVNDVVARCLERRPEQRFGEASELATELCACLSGAGAERFPARASRVLGKPVSPAVLDPVLDAPTETQEVVLREEWRGVAEAPSEAEQGAGTRLAASPSVPSRTGQNQVAGVLDGRRIDSGHAFADLSATDAIDSDEPVRFFVRDPASSYGWWRNIAICLGREPPTLNSARSYRASVERVISQYPNGVGLITVVKKSSTPPPETRDAILKLYSDLGEHLLGSLFVLEATGFAAVVQRSIAATGILVTGRQDRVKVGSCLESGIPWLVRRVQPDAPQRLTAAALESAVRGFCHDEREFQRP